MLLAVLVAVLNVIAVGFCFNVLWKDGPGNDVKFFFAIMLALNAFSAVVQIGSIT